MKSIPVAAIAVVVLWGGLSFVWMTASGASQTAAISEPQSGQPAPQSCAQMAAMSDIAGGGTVLPSGVGMAAPQQNSIQNSDADASQGPTNASSTPGIMTEPAEPVLALQELFPTSPAAPDLITRLQAVEDRLAAAVDRLEAQRATAGVSAAALGIANQVTSPRGTSWLSQFLSVISSGPVVGFVLILLLVLAAISRGRWAWNSAYGRQFQAAMTDKHAQARTYLQSIGLDTPEGRGAHWARFLARVETAQHGMINRARPVLVDFCLIRQNAIPGVPANVLGVYGDVIHGTDADGKPLQAGVFEEGQVRAAAGLTLALGAMAFSYAYFAHVYAPIQIVTTLFFLEFLIRVTLGIGFSPIGMIAHVMTRRQTPQLVSAKPKRFAWTLGLIMSLAMMIITNSGIRGPLPMTICLICLTLMWLEAVLGLCLGCEIHRVLVQRGWAERDQDYEICANGACIVEART